MKSAWLVEHKTTSEDISPGSSWWKRVITIDPQLTIYLNGLRAVGIDCRGVIYDALRKPALHPGSVPILDADGLKIVLNSDGVRVRTKDGKKWRQSPEKDQVLQSTPETPEAFEKRILQAIAKDPDRYYQRSNPVRLIAERSESDFDVWQTANQIKESRRLNVWPRNPDACMQWNRACDYLPVCTHTAEITDTFLYRKGDRVHDELAPIVDMYKCLGCGKTVPVADTYPGEDGPEVRGHTRCWSKVEALPRDPREVLTQSSLRCFRSCARKYSFRYVKGLQTLKRPEPLRAGSSIHAALNEWMRTGGDLQAALSKLDREDPYAMARERAMIVGYHCRWDRPPKVVAVEREWSSDLVDPETGIASKTFRLAGKADVIVEMTDEQAVEQREPSLARALEDSIRQRANDGGSHG